MPQPPGKPTIVQVAAAAGVGRTTASDALNGRGRVNAATRVRVQAVARELGYHANLSARGLRYGHTSALALLLPELEIAGDNLSLDYYMQISNSMAVSAFTRGYAVVLVPALDPVEQLLDLPFDGAIVSDPAAGDARVALLDARHIPVVTIDRDLARPDDRWYVATASEHNTRLALDHLADRGARRSALLINDATWSWTTETTTAYRHWCTQHHQPQTVVQISSRDLQAGAYDACRQLLDAPRPPDAILATFERFAMGAARAAADLAIRVPEDLLIVSAIDSHQIAEFQPSITAIELHPGRQGAAATAMLIARLTGHKIKTPSTIRGQLIIRHSTVVTQGVPDQPPAARIPHTKIVAERSGPQ